MDITALLSSLLNPNGSQSILGPAQAVGDHNNPALMQMSSFVQPPAIQKPLAPQMPPQAPQQQMPPQAPQGQPMPQNAPQAAPVATGGGMGDFLTNLFAPKQAGKTRTIGWLQEQGLDPGTATVLASDKGALRTYMLQRAKGGGATEFDQRAQAAQQYGVDPTTPEGRAFILTGKLGGEETKREIRADANGVPRFVDTGAAVYPSDQSASGGTQFFSGRSVEAQGLNYLIDNKTLTKEQAANVAAGKSVTGPNGEVIFMTPQGIFQQPADGGAAQPVGGQSGNIPITGPKYSEDMRKAGGFALRADQADKIVSQPNVTSAGASLGQNAKASAPFGLGNYMVSNEYQQFDQAQRDFINAVLRRESGAAISESEFQNARKQYLPQPGDGPDVIAQKAQNRQLAVQSLHQSADPVPSLTGAPAPSHASPAGSDTPPASYTGKNWKYMTPEARKLWQ